jgi:phosphate/phosphite/phosphonate ABC transporter binding protein
MKMADSLTFGCVPHTDDDLTRARLVELCGWLSDRIGVFVRPHRAPSPEALASAFSTGRVDIAWVSPALFILHPGLAAAKPLVCSVRQKMAIYHSVLFVNQTSRYKSPSDLQGARAAWVAPSSAAGYIMPRLALASHGLDPRTLFASETMFDSHGNVARAVFSGQADVGGTYAVFTEADPTQRLVRAGFDEVPQGRARILYAAGPIPSDPIVVGPKVSTIRRVEIMSAFADLRPNHAVIGAIMHVLGAESFEPVRPHAFDALQEEIRDGRALGLLDPE